MSKAGRKKELRDSGGNPAVKGPQTRGQEKGQQAAGTKPGGSPKANQGTQRQP